MSIHLLTDLEYVFNVFPKSSSLFSLIWQVAPFLRVKKKTFFLIREVRMCIGNSSMSCGDLLGETG